MGKVDFESGRYWDDPHNVFTGYSPVSEPGDPCLHGWATGFANRLGGDFTPTFHADRLEAILGKRRPRIFFCNNTSDWMRPDFPDGMIRQFLLSLEDAPEHAYLTLTKRLRRLVDIYDSEIGDLEIPNLWLGATVWDQASAEAALELLSLIPEHIWISYEPMLGGLELGELWYGIEWCTLGAETGVGHRVADPEWFASAIEQCAHRRIPVWIKAFPLPGGGITHKLSEMPPWARVRQLPPELEAILKPKGAE